MAAKQWKDRRGISFSSEEKGNYESDTGDDIKPDQTNDKYIL